MDDPAEARLLADADGRIGSGPGVALVDGHLRVSTAPGVDAEQVTLGQVEDLPTLIATWDIGRVHHAVDVTLDVDPSAPVVGDLAPLAVDEAAMGGAATLGTDLRGVGLLLLAGPGVLRDGRADDLVAAARTMGCGVLNTFGAKGLFAWDDPHHHGTVGIQRDDPALSGFADAPVVVTVGLDPAELPGVSVGEWSGPALLEVAPAHLAVLAARWPAEPPPVPPKPALFTRLADTLAAGYRSDTVPLHPARAVADLAAVAGAETPVVADPGPAGLWVARAYPTPVGASVVVPATVAPGFAVAAAMVAGLDRRPVLAVTAGPFDAATAALVDRARSWRSDVVLVRWNDGGTDGSSSSSPGAYAELLGQALDEPGVSVVDVPVDLARTDDLVDVAGPVAAWGAAAP
ncbi:MAG: hypothetical protein JJU45_11095 [Acidimicrobiia bacterium]|nr:hypothetical protein [Acidimicrobiia bacterium]